MTERSLYTVLRSIYAVSREAGEMFSFRDMWLALCERNFHSPERHILEPQNAAPDSEKIISDARELIGGRPIQYYLGYTDFCGYRFICRENVLIPRADTELLVSLICDNLPKNGRLCDLCCGSGCVAIATLLKRPDAHAFALDISDYALSLSLENARALGVEDRITIEKGNVFEDGIVERVLGFGADIIASNPPYIKSSDMKKLPANVAKEPSLALDGGSSGLDFYRRIAGDYKTEKMIFEIGFDEAADLSQIAAENSFSCTVYRDEGGRDRCVLLENSVEITKTV